MWLLLFMWIERARRWTFLNENDDEFGIINSRQVLICKKTLPSDAGTSPKRCGVLFYAMVAASRSGCCDGATMTAARQVPVSELPISIHCFASAQRGSNHQQKGCFCGVFRRPSMVLFGNYKHSLCWMSGAVSAPQTHVGAGYLPWIKDTANPSCWSASQLAPCTTKTYNSSKNRANASWSTAPAPGTHNPPIASSKFIPGIQRAGCKSTESQSGF